MTDGKYVRWDAPGVEHGAGPEEDQIIHDIEKQINDIQFATWADHRHGYSGTHQKTHGVVKGELEILGNLPPELAQGMFAKAGKYPAAMRHSTETTALIDDRVKQPRGIGLKVFNIEGEKLRPDGKDPKTQDFEFNSSPILELAKADVCREIIRLRMTHGGCPADLDAALKKRDDYDIQDGRNRAPNVSPLVQRQYSQSAFRYGDNVAKFALIPVNTEQLKDKAKEITDEDGAHGFMKWVHGYFENNGAEWDLQVQLLEKDFLQETKNLAVEDARIDWPQDRYPYVTVAKMRIPAQKAFSHKRVVFWEDRIRVDPWHGLKIHKPLGSINRVRKGVYKASSAYRRKLNATTEVMVTSLDDIPD
ncbi:unnamed protein product [Sympodiomycopsis kandeliae]